ncbi:hypothetical protein [Bacteroides acidifaciens]|uniref:hypothetical protein n=1 Tax=Bacteroides acidifaciens TaxID=85831 RepID=UPI003F692CBB
MKNTIAYYATNYMVSMAMKYAEQPFETNLPDIQPAFPPAQEQRYGEFFLAKTKEAFSLSQAAK